MSTVKETYDNPSPIIQSGYKLFKGASSSLEFEAMVHKSKKEVPLDQWLTAEESSVRADDSRNYTAGFHAFTNEAEVKRASWAAGRTGRRVYLRKVHTFGTQGGEVIVAKEMYVPSNPDGWPPKAGDPEPTPPKKSIKDRLLGKPGEA